MRNILIFLYFEKIIYFLFLDDILIFLDFWTNRTQQRINTIISKLFEELINFFTFISPIWRQNPLRLNLSGK